MSALPVAGNAQPFDSRLADRLLADGTTLVLAGGTGQPFFTTDTAAALRACQLGAAAVVKATQVNGVYSADPRLHPEAVRFSTLAFAEALEKRLKVMDATAFALCMENAVPILVYNLAEEGGLLRVLRGDRAHATLVGNVETAVA